MSFGGQGVWQPDATRVTPEISTTFQPTYTMTQTPVSGDSSKWSWNTGEYWSNQLPPAYSTVAPNAPTINLSFPQFGYFLATNLLLPGSNIFGPDATITDASNPTGSIAMPWDMIISGTIAAKLSDSAPTLAKNPCEDLSQQIQNASTASSLEDKFLSQVSAYNDSNTLATDLWNPISGDDADTITTQLKQIFTTRGYQNLNADNLSTLIDYSYDSDLKFSVATYGKSWASTPGVNVRDVPVYTFDLGVYSGVYSIDGQPDSVQLLLSPDTHAITYAGTTVVPTITSDNNDQNPNYTVSWSSGSAEKKDLVHYAINFQAVQVAKSSNFQQLFVGTQMPQTSDGSSSPATFSGTKLASTPPFDLRICGGTYVISAPTDSVGSSLYVDRADGNIEWAGDTFQPKLTLDTTTGATRVSWTAKDAAYDISFYNAAGKQYFSGYKTSSGTKSQFQGELKQDGSDPGIADSISGWETLGRSANTIDVVLSTVTVITLGIAIVRFYKRDERKENESQKAQQRDDAIVMEVVKVVSDRKGAIHTAIEAQLADQLVHNNDAWRNMDDTMFNDGARAIIQDKLDEYYKDDPDVVNVNGINDPTSKLWQEVHDALTTYVTEHVQLYGNEHMDPVTGNWKTLLHAEGYISAEVTKLTENALQPRVDQIVNKFVGASLTDPNTWARARANEVAINQVKVTYTKIYEDAKAKVTQLDNIITTYQGFIDGDKGKVSTIDTELQNPTTPDDRRAELEKEKAKLQNDIKNNQTVLDNAAGEIIGARSDLNDAGKVKDDSEANELTERVKGDQAGQSAFDL
ncbi:hypothetical protein ABW21_db0207560 [Orbilia brochopaga]|nr:hypothetical protein ABW21_db0207560 [Drechslerella brochopaga]